MKISALLTAAEVRVQRAAHDRFDWLGPKPTQPGHEPIGAPRHQVPTALLERQVYGCCQFFRRHPLVFTAVIWTVAAGMGGARWPRVDGEDMDRLGGQGNAKAACIGRNPILGGRIDRCPWVTGKVREGGDEDQGAGRCQLGLRKQPGGKQQRRREVNRDNGLLPRQIALHKGANGTDPGIMNQAIDWRAGVEGG